MKRNKGFKLVNVGMIGCMLFSMLFSTIIENSAQAEEVGFYPLLITEISPNIKGAEDYEYVELYNNTNQPLYLNDYEFLYRYTDGSDEDKKLTVEPTVIEPGKTKVLWYNKSGKTVVDFEKHYGVTDLQDELISLGGEEFSGFSNGGNRVVVLLDRKGNEMLHASYTGDQAAEDLSVHYQYPTGDKEMVVYQAKQTPTPGHVEETQVPLSPQPLSNVAITHDGLTTQSANEDMKITAGITAETELQQVYVVYHPAQLEEPVEIQMKKVEDPSEPYGGVYEGIISKEDFAFSKEMTYYIKVETAQYTKNHPIHAGEPFTVKIEEALKNEPPVINHEVPKPIENQDLTISAEIKDDTGVQSAILSYRQDEQMEPVSIPMELGEGDMYSAVIPSEKIWSDKIYYTIKANDGKHEVTSEEYNVSMNRPRLDLTKLPELLVTEVVPDSTNVNGADGYEFIEVYNTTDQSINFQDYKIQYRYPMDGPEADLIWAPQKEDITIPSGQSMVFWIINSANQNETVADFNKNYGSELVENESIVKVKSNGMSNSSDRGILVATNTGKEISIGMYNDQVGIDDTAANKGILYTYPTDGTQILRKISSATEPASPGDVLPGQVPTDLIKVEEDSEPPSIEALHDFGKVKQTENVELIFDAEDNHLVKTVALFYKHESEKNFRKVYLKEDFDDTFYHHTIYSPDLIGRKGIEYYTEVSDGTNRIKSEVKKIEIEQPIKDAIRLNVEDGDILAGKEIIKGAADGATPDDLLLKIDAKEPSNTYKALENEAYFAFDVKKTNLFFQNGVTMGEEALLIFDDTINRYMTLSVPIQSSQLKTGNQNTISIRSGTKVSPFDTNSEENRDDFYVKNIRLVMSDGTMIQDEAYMNAEQELTIGDGGGAAPVIDFNFTLSEKLFSSLAYQWDTRKSRDGLHTIQVSDPKKGSVEKTVLVDNTAPTILPTIETKEYKGKFTIDAQLVDKTSGMEELTATLDGETVELPYKTSSVDLEAGEHVVVFTGYDVAGNKAEEKVPFTVVEEQPEKPDVISPEDGEGNVTGNPKLKVLVEDPTNDELDVDFYKGYQYSAGDKNISVHANTVDTEPPGVFKPEGEKAITDNEVQLISKEDQQYMTTDSTTQFPYHRFDIEVEESVQDRDRIALNWKGKSLEGRKVSMYAWNHRQADWDPIVHQIAPEGDFTLEGSVTAKDYVKDQKVTVLVQDEIPENRDQYDYTFVWMSDTQYYSESYPYIYQKQTEWIKDQQEEMKIKYVFHTGDLVDEADKVYQWNNADASMKVLDDAGVRYGVLAGNHDVDNKTGDYTAFSKYFGEARFTDRDYYGESYQDNKGHYDLISENGNDYLMLYMGWGIEQEEIDWMNAVLAQYPDRMAILSFHEYLLVSGNRSPLADEIYEKVVVPNKNVVATLCGHYHDSELLVDEIDDDGDGTADRNVYQILADYQGGPEGGQGYLRLLHVDVANNRIYMNTYSPYLDDYNFYDNEQYPGKDEFTIDLNLEPQEKRVATDYFEVNVYTEEKIGSDPGVKSGAIAEAKWKKLAKGEMYYWYATASDQFGGKTTSDIWHFTMKGSKNERVEKEKESTQKEDKEVKENKKDENGIKEVQTNDVIKTKPNEERVDEENSSNEQVNEKNLKEK
ncbi:lamin tail domain-containing protein [Guptibacillus hwajinpoensis]|uniref:lamin tail domain-containing protein n=1 Tax=Guptibacillus hwajinpoensis TaxID=208199 RepID=UPI001CFC7FE4|nr:lamin tail domain-containing protein [Pseudalkalibacillus hwajinpoensis]